MQRIAGALDVSRLGDTRCQLARRMERRQQRLRNLAHGDSNQLENFENALCELSCGWSCDVLQGLLAWPRAFPRAEQVGMGVFCAILAIVLTSLGLLYQSSGPR